MRTRMVMAIVGWAIATGGCLLAGCGTASTMSDPTSCDPAQTPTVGDLPDAVNATLKDKCQACHSSPPKNHAPFALVSFEDTQKQFGITTKRKWQRMAEVIEPGGVPHMPYGSAPPLTADQLTTLRSWFAGCAMPIRQGAGHDLLDDGGVEPQ